jgi:hypothetical protein
MATVSGKAMWASVTTPQTRFEPHNYTITLLVDEEIASEFASEGFAVRETDDGKVLVMKRRYQRNDGAINPVPICVDKDKEPFTDRIGNGSEVVVQYRGYENQFGKFIELQGVQVLELVEYEPLPDDGEEF